MAEPSSKAIRQFPCFCSLCFGRVCDIQTLRSHISYEAKFIVDGTISINDDTLQFNSFENIHSHTPDSEEECLDETANHEVDEEDTVYESSIEEVDEEDTIDESSIEEVDEEDTVDESSIEEVDVREHVSSYNIGVSERQITELVLKEVECKLEHGNSQAEIEEYLQNAASLLGEKLIPHKWQDVLKLLRKLGYENPAHYKVCCEPTHSCLLENSNSTCPKCDKPREKRIDYYVLGLCFDSWFSTAEKCKRLLGHWEDKNEWFNKNPEEDINLIELWHGSRFRELSFFWDCKKTMLLPSYCTSCVSVVPSNIVAIVF